MKLPFAVRNAKSLLVKLITLLKARLRLGLKNMNGRHDASLILLHTAINDRTWKVWHGDLLNNMSYRQNSLRFVPRKS